MSASGGVSRDYLTKMAFAAWLSASLKESGMPGAELARRMTVIGHKMDRQIVYRMTRALRGATPEEIAAITAILNPREPYRGPMPIEQSAEPPPAPVSSKTNGDHEMGLFDVETLRQTIMGALLSPGAPLPLAQQLAED